MTTVVVPFVHGRLHPDTLKAVQYSGLWCRFVDLDPTDEGAYGRLVRQLWQSQATVIICEHDVVPTQQQLSDLYTCTHDWCGFNYDGHLYPGDSMFGLVRLSGALMARHPHAAEVALIIGKRRDTECEWWRVDSMMARDLIIRGERWREHLPVVHHAHVGPPSGPP
jgi:hypothetical protein